MNKNHQLKAAEIILAKQENEDGADWPGLAVKYGISYYMMRKQCDPEFEAVRDRSNVSTNARRFFNDELAPIPEAPLLRRDKLLERLQAGYR